MPSASHGFWALIAVARYSARLDTFGPPFVFPALAVVCAQPRGPILLRHVKRADACDRQLRPPLHLEALPPRQGVGLDLDGPLGALGYLVRRKSRRPHCGPISDARDDLVWGAAEMGEVVHHVATAVIVWQVEAIMIRENAFKFSDPTS